MKSRSLVLVLGLVGTALAVFLATSYALNVTEPVKPATAKPKNELIFNWGNAS